MSTIAEQVRQTIFTSCPSTFSLYAGYGMTGGEYVRFPGGVQEMEKRNKNGRCTRARYLYSDGSRLEFRYNTGTEQYTLEATR